jgi:hypothetical protein
VKSCVDGLPVRNTRHRHDPNQQKLLLKAYRSLLRQAKTMVEDYEHLAPDSDFKIDPTRRRRIARMREAIRKVEELR